VYNARKEGEGMSDELIKELHKLNSEKGQLQKRRNELGVRINEIEKRLWEIKWIAYPVGSIVEEKDGTKYQVSGYEEDWLKGHKIKKDGTPGKDAHNVYNLKEPK
jgi:hypothetical protein